MHVSIIYNINRYSYSFVRSYISSRPNPCMPHSGAFRAAAVAKTSGLKRKTFLKTITKEAAAASQKEQRKSFTDDF